MHLPFFYSNFMIRTFFICLSVLCIPAAIFAQALPITLDGEFDDWDGASVLFDITGTDIQTEQLHVTQMWGANDDDFLFLLIEFDQEITLLDNNPVVLLLNTDNDISTGYDPNTVGAELRWEFGEREGMFYDGPAGHWIRFPSIRLRTAPTVTSTAFEIALGRDATPAGSTPLFRSDTVHIHIRFDEQDNDAFAAGKYIFDPESVPPPDLILLERHDKDDLRVLAFNAWDDKLFEEEFTDQYNRILHALEPDIIAFQEIWDHDGDKTAERVENLFQAGNNSQWYGVKKDPGNVTVSRFPILDSWQILLWYNNNWQHTHRLTISLIDIREAYDTKLLFVNVHLRCCAWGETNRWREIHGLIDFLNNAREPGGHLYLEKDTPIILAGDFNLVGSWEQLAAIENDILDWDGTGIERVRARQTEKRMHYTWRNDKSRFSPGKLDYIFYTGSLLDLKNTYTLQVEKMSPEQRTLYGLQYGDTRVASDHLPHVADFTVKSATTVSDNHAYPEYYLAENYPNPFNAQTTISFILPESSDVSIVLYNVLGEKVDLLIDGRKSAGRHTVTFDAAGLASGVYFYRMRARDYTETRSMVFIQ